MKTKSSSILSFLERMIKLYTDNFKGLSKEIWILAGITLVNRAGMMVLPFLSIYLNKQLHFSLGQVGWILTFFGLGSFVGSWLGGKLSDIFGSYKVMVASFVLGGLAYTGIQYLHTFSSFCAGVFLLTLLADAFRPALFVTMSSYSKAENKTRSVSLIRLAINLGMSVGPFLGGLLILKLGYGILFWIDGLTNILAGIILLLSLNPKNRNVSDTTPEVENPLPPFQNKNYLIFLFSTLLFAICFFQLFSTLPLYYKDVHLLTEAQIGQLMALNGLLIFFIEMPIVNFVESRNINRIKLIQSGFIILALSFLVLPIIPWSGILVISVLLMTVAEIFVFPFTNSQALDFAKAGKTGAYMALFSMNFSIAQIVSHNAGLQSVHFFNYNNTWFIILVLVIIGFLSFYKIENKTSG